ncbi:MAG TPA: protein kinase [Acidobacteriaceae bacterium]
MPIPEARSAESGLADGEVVGERYCVRRRLGAGGMGEAYLADDLVLHRRLVLKRLKGAQQGDNAGTRLLIREAKRSSSIASPHIAQVYDVCMHRGEWLLAMEYVAGPNLREVLRAPVAASTFFDIAVQLTEAVGAAHAGGILHCDIKPENIMVTEQGFVKVLDFGLAQRKADAAGVNETTSLVDAGPGVSGTPGYMAPEVLRESPATEQSDIFSLGLVLYELAGGAAPFKGESFADSVQLTLGTEAPLLPLGARGLPEELNRLLQKALNKQPQRRYATVRDLLVDLRACQERWVAAGASTGRVQAQLARVRAGSESSTRRWAVWLGLLTVVVVLAGGAAVVVSKRAGKPVPRPGAVPARLLAVIPFHVIGVEDAGLSAYNEGLRESITSSLARAAPANGIEVLAASEVRVHGLHTPEEAHRRLGADLVIEGSYQQYGQQVRILFSLVDATGKVLHSDSVTSQLTDPFVLEDSVVRGVLSMLDLSTGSPTLFGTRNAEAYAAYLHGIGYLRDFQIAGNAKHAMESFERAIAADPGFAAAYAGLGDAHWQSYVASADARQIALARASCDKGLALSGQVAEVHDCLGTIAAGTGRVEQARLEFVRAQQRDGRDDTALQGLARTYEQSGEPAEAERVYRQAIAARPHYWANYYALGNFLLRRAQYDQAAPILESAVQQFPANSFLVRRLAVVYFMQGRMEQSAATLERAIAEQPDAVALRDLGQVYLHEGKFAPAVAALERASRTQPNQFSTEADLADAYAWSGGDRQKAEAAYHRALELSERRVHVDPHDLDALMVSAYCAAALGQKQEALRRLQEALRYAPQDAEVDYYAARVYAQLGDGEAARRWVAQAIGSGYSRADIESAVDLAAYAAPLTPRG